MDASHSSPPKGKRDDVMLGFINSTPSVHAETHCLPLPHLSTVNSPAYKVCSAVVTHAALGIALRPNDVEAVVIGRVEDHKARQKALPA